MTDVRGELGFDSVRIFIKDTLHLDFRRSAYRGLQAWKWPANWTIEIALAHAPLLKIEYTSEELWLAVLAELTRLPINGE